VWTMSAILGIAALARETTLFGLTLLRIPRSPREWLRAAGVIALAIVPLLVWQDYVWSIYRTTSFRNQGLVTTPFAAFLHKWAISVRGVLRDGIASPHMWALAATLGLTVQAAFVMTRRNYADVWWRVAMPFAILMVVLAWEAWGGFPGAAARALLPMTIAFNVLLRDVPTRRMWLWYVLGNISLIYAPTVLRST
jgi:hypothetical protein